MALRFLYFAFSGVLRLLVRRRGDAAREAEVVIPRREHDGRALAVRERSVARYGASEGLLWQVAISTITTMPGGASRRVNNVSRRYI